MYTKILKEKISNNTLKRKSSIQEKGITLIALVITIIILLILAGVTLGTALGQNGLFQRAKIAGENYKRAEADETDKLGEVEKEIDKIVNGETPSSGIGSSDIAGNLKDYQGKYVDIGLDTNGDREVNDWEIFYVNEDRIFLIAADYVPNEKLKEWGVTKSENFDSVNDDLLNTLMFGKYKLKEHQEIENSKATLQMLDKEAWDGIKEKATEKDKIDFVVGGPTLGMWCEAWNEAIDGNTDFNKINVGSFDEYGFNLSMNGEETEVCLVINMTLKDFGESLKRGDLAMLSKLGEEEKTFFPRVPASNSDKLGGYWLASPLTILDGGLLGGVTSYGMIVAEDPTDSGADVRPVITLKPKVRLVRESDGLFKCVSGG